MAPQSTVRLNSDVVDELRTYSRITGIPINRVIEDAIEHHMDWLFISLNRMLDDIRKKGPAAKLSRAQAELLSRVDDAGVIHLHNKAVAFGKPVAPTPPPIMSSGWYAGFEPTLEQVPKLLEYHQAEIKKLKALQPAK
jgi:hypothetical protein